MNRGIRWEGSIFIWRSVGIIFWNDEECIARESKEAKMTFDMTRYVVGKRDKYIKNAGNDH